MNRSPAWYRAAAFAGWVAASSAIAAALHWSRQYALLRAQSRTDAGTGLLTKAEWRRLAGIELDRAVRTRTSLAVAMIDIDHFKQVNDRFGHLAGDLVLYQVAAVIGGELRPYDLAGRFGGDEIVLLFPGTTASDAAQITRRLGAVIGNTAVQIRPDEPVTTTVSVGVSQLGESPANLDTLIAAADAALYQSKRAGRCRTRISAGSLC